MADQYISVAEAARILDVTRWRVQQLIRAGQLAGRWRNGREKEVLLADVQRRRDNPPPAGRRKK